MKRFFALAALWAALTCSAFAAPGKPAKTSAPVCPQCKMPLAAKPDKAHSAAVKINGKTFYCCTACGAHKSAKAPAKALIKSGVKPTVKAAAKAEPTKAATAKAATAKTPAKAAEAPKCPKCAMQMTLTKSLLKGTPMKVNGVTYYCCSVCPMH